MQLLAWIPAGMQVPFLLTEENVLSVFLVYGRYQIAFSFPQYIVVVIQDWRHGEW